MPGTGSVVIFFDSLTILGLGPYIYCRFAIFQFIFITRYVYKFLFFLLKNCQLVILFIFYLSGIYNNFAYIQQNMYNNRMMEENYDLQAQIKADFFTDIFDSMTKNMKENQKLFFIFTHKQMKMWLCQSSKTTQLQLKISAKAFKQYTCNFPAKETLYRKYQLKKLLWFPSFFEGCKGNLKIYISQERIQFQDSNNGNRKSRFPVQGQQISPQEQDDLKNTNVDLELDQRNSYSLIFPKSKIIQEVIHSGNGMKVAKLWLSYLTNKKRLRFDFKANGPYLQVKSQVQQARGSQISKVPFPFRKLKLATSLIESQKPLKMSLSRNCLIIHYDEQNVRKYSISVMAELDE